MDSKRTVREAPSRHIYTSEDEYLVTSKADGGAGWHWEGLGGFGEGGGHCAHRTAE